MKLRSEQRTLVGCEDGDGLRGVSGSGGHDENRDVLLEGEGAGVEEGPNTTSVSRGKGLVPRSTEDEGNNLKEELRNVDGLGTEVEDLAVKESVNELLLRDRSDGETHLTENGGEAGQSNSEDVHPQGVDDHVGVVFEGHASGRDILSSLQGARNKR
jgi:hypothetical protein